MGDIILPRGNYENLESYKNSVVIYDATQVFCQRYLTRGDRTVDQMIQAARSGKQNIVEGCQAARISSETEIKLTGVARASLQELLEDYQDYLRTHHLTLWAKDDPRTLRLRAFLRNTEKTYAAFQSYLECGDPELFCNLMISMIHQTNYLLDRLLQSLEKTFVANGGLRERMYYARIEGRKAVADFSCEINLLREIRRELLQILPEDKKTEILAKIKQVALSLKKRCQ